MPNSFLKTSLTENWGKLFIKCCMAWQLHSSFFGFSFFCQVHNQLTSWNWVFLEKLIVAKLVKTFLAYYEIQSLLLLSQESASNPYPQPLKYVPYIVNNAVMHKPLLFQICTLFQNYNYPILLYKEMCACNIIIFMHMCLSSLVL